MEALDTNILIRLATRDDKRQFAKANELVRTRFSSSSPAWISLIVLVEYIWVLGSLYGYSRDEIAFSVSRLLNADSFQVEDHPLVVAALADFNLKSAVQTKIFTAKAQRSQRER